MMSYRFWTMLLMMSMTACICILLMAKTGVWKTGNTIILTQPGSFQEPLPTHFESSFHVASPLPSFVKRIDDWGHGGIRFAQWNHGSEADKPFYEKFLSVVQPFIKPGSTAVDIGGHAGDTVIPIAFGTKGGRTIVFEMGPPFDVLAFNVELNPQLNIDIYRKAVSNKFGVVQYSSGCQGCNGGIADDARGKTMGEKVESVRLEPFLIETYGSDILKNISFIKIDTEGHDIVILKDLKNSTLIETKPVFWIEWFAGYRSGDPKVCTPKSQALFDVIHEIGYVPHLNASSRVTSCNNANYKADLLLLPEALSV